MLTYDFRLPPGPRTVEYALLAEDLGFRAVWCPEIPAFGHDIWVTLARIAEKTKRIKLGPSVLIPSYRHPMAQASAIATLEQIAPGRLMVGFGTGFTGRAGMGKKPLSLASMRTHITQVKALLRGGRCCRDRLGCRRGPDGAGWPSITGNPLPCRSNTMPNTVIIFRDPGIGSRTGRSTRRHCGGAAA